MKRWLAVFGTIVVAGLPAQTSFSAHLGTNLFRYEQAYLVTGVTVVSELADQMELNVGADFGIATQQDADGTVNPEFLIPVATGLNFTFPSDPTTFYLGIGLVPSFHFAPAGEPSFQFYLGPYAKTGLRVRVHSIMSAFVDVEQQLLFGGPTWINTTTRVVAGVYFSFPPTPEAAE